MRIRRAGLAVLVLTLCAPGAALADGVADHAAQDAVAHDAAVEPRLAAATREATAADARAAAAAVAGDEHLVGQWGPLTDWPVVGVHVALMPDGKVLAYDSVGDHATETYPEHTFTRATLWDPVTGTHTPATVLTGYNVFCSGLAHLPDGTLFVAGGNKNAQLQGIRQTHVYNGAAWALGADMSVERWYPSVTPLSNGEMLITEGGPDLPEVRTTTGAIRPLSTASLNLPLYPWLDVAPDGRAFYSGPDQTLRAVATGGNSSGAGLVDLANGVYAAERWDPATGTWTTLAAESATRQYHSTALLLADGRVLSSGGGICGTCDAVGYLAKNAQVFTPPYLFKADGSGELAPRPAITSAPATAAYGSGLVIGTPDAAAIRKVGLVRLGAVTHSVNMEQRYVPLGFTAGSGSLTATAPANANLAPPGVYMLFLVDATGVPSVARMVTLGGTAPPPPPPPPSNTAPTVSLTAPANGATFPWKPTIDVTATASDTDGTVARVEFLRNGVEVAEDLSAPYAWRWKNAPAGSHALAARAVDDDGATTTTPAVTITVQRK